MSRNTVEKKYGFEFPFKPDPLSRKALKSLPPGGKLLDAGCGEGADSSYFARKGYRVSAIDKNRAYLRRLRAYCRDEGLSRIDIRESDVSKFKFRRDTYDVVISLLVLCCMKRSQFESMLPALKRCVKPGGIVVMSARNYLDPEYQEYRGKDTPIEQNTFRDPDDCCKFVYFIEQDRLRQLFEDFDILHYYEGFSRCKYKQHPKHGDSNIICRRRG